jgi:hypothetical protein
VRRISTGHGFMVLLIAHWKYMLLNLKMTAGERLRILEAINNLTDHFLSEKWIAGIPPMTLDGIKMMHEVQRLPPDNHSRAMFEFLGREDVFEKFVQVTPGLADWLEAREQTWGSWKPGGPHSARVAAILRSMGMEPDGPRMEPAPLPATTPSQNLQQSWAWTSRGPAEVNGR